MEYIFSGVDWLAVVVGAFAAFILGSAWFGEHLFGKKWRQGLGTPAVPNRAMGPLLAVEAVACLLQAWLVILLMPVSAWLAALAAVTLAASIKSNDLFAGKSHYTVAVDAGYVLAKVVVIVIAYQLFN
jgi:hypothetical protein